MLPRACAVLALSFAACGGIKEAEKRDRDIGQQTADITSDRQVLGDASAAVNEVIRNQDDCDVARPAITKAITKLDEAARHGRTATGRTTLDGLRAQVRGIAQNCP
jgi:hypothetical protein